MPKIPDILTLIARRLPQKPPKWPHILCILSNTSHTLLYIPLMSLTLSNKSNTLPYIPLTIPHLAHLIPSVYFIIVWILHALPDTPNKLPNMPHILAHTTQHY